MKTSRSFKLDMYLANSIGTFLEIANDKFSNINNAWKQFINSKFCQEIENKNCCYTSASGIDIFHNLVRGETCDQCVILKLNKFYWAGWIICQYQQYCQLSYKKINEFLPISDIVDLYHPYHEQDVLSFFKFADKRLKNNSKSSNLKIIRNKLSISQKELSILSGVKLRTIQMLEQRNLNINKTQVNTLINLSKILNCKIEDLLE